MANTETVTVAGDNLTVSKILWRRFRRAIPNLVERTYAMNPGLADLGDILPVGTKVTFPVDAPTTTAPRRRARRLWD